MLKHQQETVERRNPEEETDRASTVKPVASLLGQQEQNVKDEDEGNDQVSIGPPSTTDSGIWDVRIQGLQKDEFVNL